MSFTAGDAQISQKQSVFLRYAWQISDFTCEGLFGVLIDAVVLGRRHQAEALFVGRRVHVGDSHRILNESPRTVHELSLPSASAGRRPAGGFVRQSHRACRAADGRLYFPEPDVGTSGNFYTKQISRELRDDLSITTGSHTWKFGAGAQELAVHGDNRPSLGTWTFSVDQPFNPANLASFVPWRVRCGSSRPATS
jgi:hypothetical protein